MIEEKQQLFIHKAKKMINFHFEKNPNFVEDFQNLSLFYNKRLQELTNGHVTQKILESFYLSIKGQLLNGYVVGLQLIETQPEDTLRKFLSSTDGNIRDQLPQILKEIANEPLANLYITEIAQNFILEMIKTFEDVRKPLRQFFVDMMCYGMWLACLDKRNELNIDTPPVVEIGALGNTTELHFVSPAHYLICERVGKDYEKWELNYWSSYEQENIKAGEFLILKDQDSTIQLLSYLTDDLTDFEQRYILSNMEQQLRLYSSNPNIRIIVEVAIVKGFYRFIQ